MATLPLVLLLLVSEWLVVLVTAITEATKAAKSAQLVPGISNILPGCVYRSWDEKIEYLSWIPGLIMSSTLFSLTMYKTVGTLCRHGVSDPGMAPLSYILFRDGVIYYLMWMVPTVGSMALVFAYPNRLLPAISEVAIPPVFSIAACRLYLNIREVDEARDLAASKSQSIELCPRSGLIFAHEEAVSVLPNNHTDP
ncbi:hypothetical protein OE88DRAFT_834393 [Heliocybe sulcata]|uniref:Uncharacterized protein n=1 Tax=Heliocybe sulcata TaxID=5364 RepID=A0A5C3MQ50_9AGAM|nr:hypothetical protein OE88DRAFT_834393 [Heliocybe sulcata]